MQSAGKWLKEKNLMTRNGDDMWKTCKLLGSLLDTEKDINRRKTLSIDVFRTLKNIFNSINNSIKIKMRTFKAYVASVFSTKNELWALTKEQEHAIYTFQCRHLRKYLGLYWPKNISNTELYVRTKTEPWSTTIIRTCMNWLGHLIDSILTPMQENHSQSSWER